LNHKYSIVNNDAYLPRNQGEETGKMSAEGAEKPGFLDEGAKG